MVAKASSLAAMERVFRLVENLEQSEATVLLTGESGTGKEVLARAIHAHSPRRGGPFVGVNCGALPGELLESELFGHVRGAFTGAVRERAGRFEVAAGGTLFLDEVADLPVQLQVKLLRVLQERTFERVGESESRHSDARIIAATNVDLVRAMAEGRFRDDFYYRLCSDVIQVPTLRERIADSPRELEGLVGVVVARIAGERQADLVSIALEAIRRDLPRDYSWPGNVRELEQAVRRILLTGRYASDLGAAAVNREQQFSDLARTGQLNAKDLLGRYCAMLYRQLGTYAEVATRTGLDRRTARKYIVDYSAPTQLPD